MCGCTFSVDYVARALCALFWHDDHPVNFTRHLAKALLESPLPTIDLSEHLSPSQLETFLACLQGIAAELASEEGLPSKAVQAAFHGFQGEGAGSAQRGFALNFDLTYGFSGIPAERSTQVHAASGHNLLVSAVMQHLEASADVPGFTGISLGCGDARVTARYAPSMGKGSRLLLLDLYPEFLRQAEERFSALPELAIPLRASWAATSGPQGGVASLAFDMNQLCEERPFPGVGPESVDFVEASMCVHHVLDFAALCAELARVLRPGGVLFLFDGFDYQEGLVNDEPPEFPKVTFPVAYHGIEAFRTQKEAVAELKNAGFAVARIVRVDPCMTFLQATKMTTSSAAA